MRNFLQPGDTLDMVAPSGGVVSGNGYLIGAIFGVAAVTAAQGETFPLARKGVFCLASATGAGTDFAAGVRLYWDDTNKLVTKVALGNVLIGLAAAAKAAGGTTGDVVLIPPGLAVQGPAVADGSAINTLLAALRTAGVIAT